MRVCGTEVTPRRSKRPTSGRRVEIYDVDLSVLSVLWFMGSLSGSPRSGRLRPGQAGVWPYPYNEDEDDEYLSICSESRHRVGGCCC